MHETLRRSSIGEAAAGSPVNLERAMAANGRFGGHIVTGHIDGTGTICEVKSDEIAVCYSIKAPEKIMHYIVEKGSVAVDGISLTVAKTTQTTFMVSVIPHTAQCTVLAYKKAGDTVNLENDCIGKYIEHFLNWEKEKTTESKLKDQWMAGLDMRDFRSLDELRGSLYAYVQSYNLAPHSSLRGMSPQDRFFSEPDHIRCLTQDNID